MEELKRSKCFDDIFTIIYELKILILAHYVCTILLLDWGNVKPIPEGDLFTPWRIKRNN